jgi:hypothetical protein
MSLVRTVRPRPLGVDERIPVFWAGHDIPLEIKAVDGGSLYRYLVAGTPKTGQKRQRGDKYHAPCEVHGGGRARQRRGPGASALRAGATWQRRPAAAPAAPPGCRTQQRQPRLQAQRGSRGQAARGSAARQHARPHHDSTACCSPQTAPHPPTPGAPDDPAAAQEGPARGAQRGAGQDGDGGCKVCAVPGLPAILPAVNARRPPASPNL